MDKARNMSTIIDPLTVLKGVDQRLLAEVLEIVRSTSADDGKSGTVGTGQESDRDGWGKTVPQGSKSTLNTTVKERAVPLRSILKQPSTSIRSHVDDLENGGTASDLQKNTMDGWLPAPSKAKLKSDGERNAMKGAEEIGKAIETVVSRQHAIDTRSRNGVQASMPWGVNEGHVPRFRPPFVHLVDPVIRSCQMRYPRPPPWHLRGEDHLSPPYRPPFAPIADGMVARPRPMAPPAEFNIGSRSRLVVPSQYDAYRQVSRLPERAGPQVMYRGDRPFAMAMNHDAPFGGEGRFFPECPGPFGATFADPWLGPHVDPVSQAFGMHANHAPGESQRSSFVSREIIDHNHMRVNLGESFPDSERTSLQKDEDFQWKSDRHRRSKESSSRKRHRDTSRDAPRDGSAGRYDMELKRKVIQKIVGVVAPCDRENRSDGNRGDARNPRRPETAGSGRLEKSGAKFPAQLSETPAPGGNLGWNIKGPSSADLDDDDEKLRRKLLSEVDRRKRDLERNLELYRLQNAATEKSVSESLKALRKASSGEWTDPLSSNNTRPDVEFKDFCGFPCRKVEAGNVGVDSEDENSEFFDPDFISACKSIATVLEERSKMATMKEQSEVDERMSPNDTEKFSGITNEAQKFSFPPEKDFQRPTPEPNTRSSLDDSAMTKTRTFDRNEVSYPPPSSSSATARSSAKLVKEPGSSSVLSSSTSTSVHANRITESETGQFTEFLKEERAAFWENLKAQLSERCLSQVPLGGAIEGELKAKTDEKSSLLSSSNSDCLIRTKTIDLEEKLKELKELERHKSVNEELKVKEKKQRVSDSNKDSIRSGKPRLGDTLDDAVLKIQPKTFSKERNRNKPVRKEMKKPGEAKRQVPHASHNKKAFEDNFKSFQEDADWRLLTPEAALNKDGLWRGETGVKSKPFSSSNVTSKRSKIVRGIPRKAGAGSRMSGQRNEGCEFRQKTGQKLVSNDKDSRLQPTKKSQNVKISSLGDRVLQRKAAQLKKKTHPGKYSDSSGHHPEKDSILYSDIEDVESSDEQEKTYSLDRRTRGDVNQDMEIKDIRERSHEDYDGRRSDKNATAFDQDQRGYGFHSANKIHNRSGGFKIRLDANSGRRHVEGSDPPGSSGGAPRQKRRGFKDVDMRHHDQGYRARDFSGRNSKEYVSDEANTVDHGDFPKYKNRYPRGRVGNRRMASRHFQKNFDNSDAKEFYKSRHDNDDRKDERFPEDWHQYEYPEERALHFGTKRGSRRLCGRRYSNDRHNDDEVWYKEPDYTPDPDFEDAWNQDGAKSRRDNSSVRCSDDNEATPKFIRPFQTEGQRFQRPETGVLSDNYSGTFGEEYCEEEEEEEPMEENVEPCWNDRDMDDREVAAGGHWWKNRTFEPHRSRAFHHGNAANMKQRFWKHKPWNNASRLPGFTYRQNFVRQHRNKVNFKKAKTSSGVTEKAWNPEGTLPATSHSLQDIIKDVMAKVEEAKTVDPMADDAIFQSLSRGEKKQVLEVQQMTGIASKAVIVTALQTLWELEPKVVRTLGGLEPDVIQQIGDDR